MRSAVERERRAAAMASMLVAGVCAALGAGGAASCASPGLDGLGGAGGDAGTTASVSTTVEVSSSATTTASSVSVSASSSVSVSSSAVASTGTGTMCGDGIIQPPEQCEGTDFGGKTCMTFGLQGGTLQCNAFCGIVVSNCTPAETCNDGFDNDVDGFIDCDDPDCVADASCIDSCAVPMSLTIPGFAFGDITGRPDLLTSSCMPQAGREIVFQFTAVSTADILFQVTFANFDPGISIRTACDDPTSEIACVNANSGPFSIEGISFPAQMGQTYYAIVEAVDDGAGSYDVQVDEILPESSCTDFFDNDFDGYLDCDDASACQGSFDCTPGTGEPGTPCFQNQNCASSSGNDPICLPSWQGFPNGYCSEFCDVATNDCPGDAQCAQIGISHDGVCLDGCVVPADCQPGYACVEEGLPTKVCDKPPEVACNDNQDNDGDGLKDCEDTTSCTTSAACVPGPGAAGDPCQLHNECQADANDPFCIDQFNFGWPGGYCSQFCNVAANDCPAGSVCSNWVFVPSGNGLCMKTCTGPADCRTGFNCFNSSQGMICAD